MESLQIKMEDWIPELSSHKNGDTASVEALNVDCRLCLKNVPKNLTKTDIQELYQVTSAKIHFPKLHNDVDAKHKETKMIFIQFSSRFDAETARNQINSNKTTNIRASFAEKPKQKQCGSQQLNVTSSTSNYQTSSINEQTESSKRKELIGSCERCGLNAKNTCDVCALFYCSPSCQSKDWSTHIKICKPMPKLVAASEKFGIHISNTSVNCSDEDSATDNEQNNASFQTFQTTPEIPKIKFVVPFVECTIIKNATVVITAICNVNRLYVRLVGSDYKKMVAEIAEYVLKAKKQVKIPELDDVVLAPFEGIFYRAQILTIDTPDAKGNDLGVLFIDYGNFSKVSSKNLKKLDYKHRSLKRHAFKVTLKDVNSRIANEASLLYLNSLLENKEKLLVTEVSSNPNDRIVSLLKISTEENVNKAIVNLSVVEEVSDNDEVVMYEDISPLPLATGCEITLFVTDCKHLNSGVISCIPADSIPELCQTKKTIEEYGFKTKDMKYSPIINEVCLILVGKSWYRAVVVDQAKVKDSFDFYLIDWCRMEVNISNENIRKMPKQFGNPKPRAHLCCIQNRTSTEAKNFINNAKVDLTFTVTSIELNDENQFCLNF